MNTEKRNSFVCSKGIKEITDLMTDNKDLIELANRG